MPTTIRRVKVALVRLWGSTVGAVAWNENRNIGEFEYDPAFVRQGWDVAPLMMARSAGIYSFPELNSKTFHGLPGLLADTLPDRYGNRLIDLWLERQGRSARDFTPVERLCYMGARGMGALEFRPALVPQSRKAVPIEISELVELAGCILADREGLNVSLRGQKEEALNSIIRVGTSAGGNRAKAVIAWNPQTEEVRSGQVTAPEGFEPWILKFDGVNDAVLGDPKGFGRIEYAYHKMAVAAGIKMCACRLLEEHGRAHFMTRRFDREPDGGKIHVQSLCALGHYDFNASGEYGYEQAFSIIQEMNLGYEAMREMFRRMVFNILARNQDDHSRNVAFLMDRKGRWSLSHAFDVIWAFNPVGTWTNLHQMSVNGKRDDFTPGDMTAVAEQYGIKKAGKIIEEVATALSGWSRYAAEAGVDAKLIRAIAGTHRLYLADGTRS